MARRLEAIAALQERGWPIGLRFDPLIYDHAYEERYRDLFASRVLQDAPRRSALS